MRVAVIGAGVAGVACAHELALAGHEVTVFERRASVAEEASFAPAGVAAPGLAAPWRPERGWWAGLRPGAHPATAAVAGSAFREPGLVRARAAERSRRSEARAAALHRLLGSGLARLDEHIRAHGADFSPGRGLLLLVRGGREIAQAEAALAWLAAQGERAEWLAAERLAAVEPALVGLPDGTRVAHLAQARVGNPREWTHLLRAAAQQLGARFLFQREVLAIQPGTPVRLLSGRRAAAADPLADAAHGAGPAAPGGASDSAEFDAVVLCAGGQAPALLDALGLKLPWVWQRACTVTAPAQVREAALDPAPRAAVLSLASGICISRLGNRVRVAGGHESGPASPGGPSAERLKSLYAALDAHFPGAVHWSQAQIWQTSRATVADGLPVVGASGLPGLWLNLAHAHAGWALGQAAAQGLAQRLGAQTPTEDLAILGPERLSRP